MRAHPWIVVGAIVLGSVLHACSSRDEETTDSSAQFVGVEGGTVLAPPACKVAASCSVAGAKCGSFDAVCDGAHEKEKRTDCDCAGAAWKCTSTERDCGEADAGSVSDAGGATDAAADAVEAGPALGLVAWYRFDEISGTKAVNSGTGGAAIDGVLGSEVAMGAAGRVGSAFHFDGTAASIVSVADLGASPLDLPHGMTVELWVRPDAIDVSSVLISKATGALPSADALVAGSSDGYMIDLWVAPAPGQPGYNGGYPGSYFREASFTPADPTTGQRAGGEGSTIAGKTAAATWYHLAFAAGGSPTKWEVANYVNGSYGGGSGCQADLPLCGELATNDAPLTIGGARFGSFRGTVDEVKIWDRKLTQAEICAEAGGTFDATTGCHVPP